MSKDKQFWCVKGCLLNGERLAEGDLVEGAAEGDLRRLVAMGRVSDEKPKKPRKKPAEMPKGD
jgi:hypothetical protein